MPEPAGGAQRAPDEAIASIGREIASALKDLAGRKPAELVRERRQKYLDMGQKGLAA